MGNKSKNSRNYLVQGSVLVVASFIARAIGMIYRIPLSNILGDTGNTYYSTANEIYSILLMISTFSLPLAVSRLVAERLHMGQAKNAHKVFVCSVKFAVVAGGVICRFDFSPGRTSYKICHEGGVRGHGPQGPGTGHLPVRYRGSSAGLFPGDMRR